MLQSVIHTTMKLPMQFDCDFTLYKVE